MTSRNVHYWAPWLPFFYPPPGVAAILGTRYLQGIGITVLYVIFSSSIMLVMSLIFGVSLIGLMAGV